MSVHVHSQAPSREEGRHRCGLKIDEQARGTCSRHAVVCGALLAVYSLLLLFPNITNTQSVPAPTQRLRRCLVITGEAQNPACSLTYILNRHRKNSLQQSWSSLTAPQQKETTSSTHADTCAHAALGTHHKQICFLHTNLLTSIIVFVPTLPPAQCAPLCLPRECRPCCQWSGALRRSPHTRRAGGARWVGQSTACAWFGVGWGWGWRKGA